MLCLPGGVNDPWLSPGDDARSVWDCTPVPPDVVMFSGELFLMVFQFPMVACQSVAPDFDP